MATKYFRGDATAVAQVTTIAVGGVAAAGQVYTVTCNGKTISYTALVADTNALIGTGLYTALVANAHGDPEFSEATYADNTTGTVTATADEAGRPFTFTGSATGTGTLTVTTTTANSGPHNWDVAANWSPSGVPVNGDAVVLRDTDTDILYGIDQNAVTLLSLDIDSTYTGKIGLPDFNPAGYFEYRETYLKIGATTAYCGKGQGSGSQRVRLNVGTVQTALNVYRTGSAEDTGRYAFDFLGTNANNTLVMTSGSFGAAVKQGTSAVFTTAKIGGQDNPLSDVAVLFGDGVTLGTVLQTGGNIIVRNGFTTWTITDGVLTVLGTANVTTINADGGTVNYEAANTCTTYRGGTNSLLDCSRNDSVRTFTNLTLEPSAGLRDPGKTATFTNPIAVRCKLSELRELDLGEQFNLQRT